MQSCKNCNASWTFHKQLDICPFCGVKLLEQIEIKTIDDAFKCIINKHGIHVFDEGSCLIALLADYAPALHKEYSLIKIAVTAGVYAQLFEARESTAEEQIKAFNKCVYILYETHFLAENWAKEVMMWEAKALNMSIPCIRESISDKQTEANTIETSSKMLNQKKTAENSYSSSGSVFLSELWKRSVE